jgi:hypothetical protein
VTTKRARAASFLAAAGAVGAAGVLTRLCPGSCVSCATCATTLVPMGASFAGVALALAGSAAMRARTTADPRGKARTQRPSSSAE